VVVVLACSGTVALAGVAAADARLPGSFCSTARNLANDVEDFDPGDVNDRAIFEEAEKVYRKLEKQAPAALEKPLARITAYYRSLRNADRTPTDPEQAAAFIEQATKAAKALQKVFRHLETKCSIDF
jgi:hypothetical protein